VLRTVPLTMGEWGYVFLMCFIIIPVDLVRKVVVRPILKYATRKVPSERDIRTFSIEKKKKNGSSKVSKERDLRTSSNEKKKKNDSSKVSKERELKKSSTEKKKKE